MADNLAQFLQLVDPDPDSALLDLEAWQTICRLAEQLPCIPRVLLECRLASGERELDLSQGFVSADHELMKVWLNKLDAPKMRQFRVLEDILSSPDGILPAGTCIWLEYDLSIGQRSAQPVPGVFLQVQGGQVEEDEAFRRENLSLQSLREILGYISPWFSYKRHLAKLSGLMEVRPAGVNPSYVGIMLSRPQAPLRFQLSGMNREALEAVLSGLNLTGDHEEMLALAFRYFKQVVLCLDLSPKVSERVGLELFQRSQLSDDAEQEFLSELVRLGLCCPQKLKELRTWPERAGPGHGEIPWPDSLIVKSLMRSERDLGFIERRVNHYKLVYSPGRRLEVKVYLAVDQIWASAT